VNVSILPDPCVLARYADSQNLLSVGDALCVFTSAYAAKRFLFGTDEDGPWDIVETPLDKVRESVADHVRLVVVDYYEGMGSFVKIPLVTLH
jgi:hypothetical protein